MKTLIKKVSIILSILIVSSCSKDELYDNVSDNSVNVDPPKTLITPPIYPTSIQNNEWNSGWYTTIYDWAGNGGTSQVIFMVSGTFIDFDKDGDVDVFVAAEQVHDDTGYRIGQNYPLILENQGVKDGIKQWKTRMDLVETPYKNANGRNYRKLTSADIDNDGDLDIVAFNAEDPQVLNSFRIMGGIDIFRNNNGKFVFEEVVPYQEGHNTYFHGGTLGDVNNDGWVDIIGGGTSPKVYLNNSGKFENTFFEPTMFKEGFYDVADIYSIEIFDINQDGYNDLLVGAAKKPWSPFYSLVYTMEDFGRNSEIYFGKAEYPYFETYPSIRLEPEINYAIYGSRMTEYTFDANMDWVVTDFDNDGDYDIFTGSMKPQGIENNTITYYENIDNKEWVESNDKVFVQGQQYFDKNLSWIKVWDIDGDGKKEILIEASSRNPNFNAWKQNSEGKYYQTLIRNNN